MHLRRALLLFALVLGLATITASLSRSRDEPSSERAPASDQAQQAPPTASAGPEPAAGAAPREPVMLDAAEGDRARIAAGRAVTLEVSVEEPGLVEIPALGLSASAEPLTPARFELLLAEPGRVRVAFTPVSEAEPQRAGTLLVRES